MHNAMHSSGGISRRPTLEPHHSADSTLPKRASQKDHINLHSSPAASSHRASSGRRQACFSRTTCAILTSVFCLAPGPSFRQNGLRYG
jgi:hypothetical protein